MVRILTQPHCPGTQALFHRKPQSKGRRAVQEHTGRTNISVRELHRNALRRQGLKAAIPSGGGWRCLPHCPAIGATARHAARPAGRCSAAPSSSCLQYSCEQGKKSPKSCFYWETGTTPNPLKRNGILNKFLLTSFTSKFWEDTLLPVGLQLGFERTKLKQASWSWKSPALHCNIGHTCRSLKHVSFQNRARTVTRISSKCREPYSSSPAYEPIHNKHSKDGAKLLPSYL